MYRVAIPLLYPCVYFVYCRGIECRLSFVSCPAYYADLLCIPPIGNRHRRLLLTRDSIPHVVSILLLVFCARDFNERDSSSVSSLFDTDISSYYYLYYPISTYLAAKWTFLNEYRSFSCISQKKVVTLQTIIEMSNKRMFLLITHATAKLIINKLYIYVHSKSPY